MRERVRQLGGHLEIQSDLHGTVVVAESPQIIRRRSLRRGRAFPDAGLGLAVELKTSKGHTVSQGMPGKSSRFPRAFGF
jgi:hypothetical protein